jgi:hypothetical protein
MAYASPVTYVGGYRSVSVGAGIDVFNPYASATNTGLGFREEIIFTSGDGTPYEYPPFLYGAARATQRSIVAEGWIEGVIEATAWDGVDRWYGSALVEIEASFTVSQPLDYSITSFIEFDYPMTYAGFSLYEWSSGRVFEFDTLQTPEPGFSQSGVLLPGSYRFFARAWAQAIDPFAYGAINEVRMSFDFQIPTPGSVAMAVLAVGPLMVGRRRR